MRRIYDASQGQYVFNSIDVGNLEINDVPINPSSGGSGGVSSITSPDSSVTLTKTTLGYAITNAGSQWATFRATDEVNFGANNIVDIAAIDFASFSSDASLTLYQNYSGASTSRGLFITDGVAGGSGNVGNIFDSKFNVPTMGAILGNSSNCFGYDITNAGNVKLSKYLEIGNGVADGTSQIHFCFDDGTTATNNIQMISSASGVLFQHYDDGTLQNNMITIGMDGTVTVSNGSSSGRVYDDTIYRPPSSSGSSYYGFEFASVEFPSGGGITANLIVPFGNLTKSWGESNFFKLQIDNMEFSSIILKNAVGGVDYSNCIVTLYLTNSQSGAFNSNIGNQITLTGSGFNSPANNVAISGNLWFSNVAVGGTLSALYLVAYAGGTPGITGASNFFQVASIDFSHGLLECFTMSAF